MGIPKLNSYLTDNCGTQSIDKKHLSIFRGKTIVIDISIYLYKFIANNGIVESLYQMVRTFEYYQIKPIFIFDGKPPDEKKELIYKRNDLKNEAEKRCISLQNDYDILYIKKSKTQEEFKRLKRLKNDIDKVRKQCIRVTWGDTERAKRLLYLCNVEYFVAEGEADQICVQMVLNKTAWACMSDDMDMFVYGCTRVMRGLSLYNHTVMFYNINGILRELDIRMDDFRRIAVLSGTDYNINQSVNIKDVLKQFNVYNEVERETNFYTWYSALRNITLDYDKLNQIYDMFSIRDVIEVHKPICDIKPDMTLIEFLRPHGLVFAS